MFGFLSRVTDPVCKMSLDKDKTQFSKEAAGNVYYFCSQNCLDKFTSSPDKWVDEKNKGNHSCC